MDGTRRLIQNGQNCPITAAEVIQPTGEARVLGTASSLALSGHKPRPQFYHLVNGSPSASGLQEDLRELQSVKHLNHTWLSKHGLC